MAKRRKNRTHNKGAAAADPASDNTPKTFIVKHGQVGASLNQLVHDMRKVMEPNTASRLRERTRNKLKDYISLAPALHVSHIILFTLTDKSPYMRIVRTPSGPTATFRIERYSTMKDVLSSKRKAKSPGVEYRTPPLLVLSSFPSAPPQLPLLSKMFQSVFPPLSPLTLRPSSARRVVLISYSAETSTLQLRHYLISIRSYGISRRVRKVLKPGMDLGNVKDVADYLLGEEGYETASSAGSEGEEVEMPERRGEESVDGGRKRAVKLEEVGPRLELRLVKITEGAPGKEGGVIFHEFVHKSSKEKKKQDAEHRERERVRKQRREEQERNVQAKKAAAGELGEDDEDDETAEDVAEPEVEEDGVDGDDEEQWEDDVEEAEASLDGSDAEDEEEAEEERRSVKKKKTGKNGR